jgi:hypothetical protein
MTSDGSGSAAIVSAIAIALQYAKRRQHMGVEQLAGEVRASPFTDDDRIMHTRKMVERSFGRSVEELGTVEMREGGAVLVFDWGGKQHTMRWVRGGRGHVSWYVDDDPAPLVLGSVDQAAGRLAQRMNRLS